ncbi:UDP-galactose/UDP-glucose transporter like [Melia azedarach]|uniref:UDP-galactose/UDP-glucose transporter like n=1 Tax=Melia azedarach TaxID=155640 RepID=A0ACC1YRC0_MELAZ|nr:UDP-galactose/UDP-glucose transporter like [Melia azedarach]
MAEPLISETGLKDNRILKMIFAVSGIMTTLVIYGILQEKIMRVPYGVNKEYFRYSLFLVFCNRLTTSAVSAGTLLASKKALDPVAPVYKYCLISVSNILTTTCQYEALKYVSFPVQTLAKCAKMIPVMIWGTFIMQKRYKGFDYFWALLVTLGCSIFILFPAGSELSPYSRGRENTVWGVSLMVGYLGFDGFTSTFQDKLFKGYNMEIHNQIFYTTLCSCVLSLTGLILEGHLLLAVDFVYRHHDCIFDIALLSTVATISQFFISYTIRTFGALTFATVMTTRQLVSIVLSCVWFAHPLSWEQWIGAVIVFGSLYARSFLKKSSEKPPPSDHPMENMHNGARSPVKASGPVRGYS